MPLKVNFTDAKGKVEEQRKLLHAWATKNPFTFGTITLVIGIVLGYLLT